MKRAHTLLCVASAMCAGTGSVHAQHSVSFATELERIENPLLASTSPGGATVVRLVPNYSYEVQGERYRSRFSAGAVMERSSNTLLLASRNYPSLGYLWSYNWPTASLELRANLAESSTRNSELQDLGRVTVDSRERSFVTGATWNKELTARTRLTLAALNNRVTYDSGMLEDYREQEVSSRLSWEANERTTYYIEPAHSRLTPSGGSVNSTMTRWVAGVQGQFAQDWALTAYAGQARTERSIRSTNNVGGLRLTYTGSRLSSDAEWTRSMGAVGSAEGYVRTEATRLRTAYRVAEGATVSAGLSRTRSVGIISSTGSVFSVTLENQLGMAWSSILGVEDRRSKDVTGVSGRGWAVRAGLVYSYSGL